MYLCCCIYHLLSNMSDAHKTYIWVILLNLVHTGNLQFLAIFYNLDANEDGFLPKNSKL